MNWRGIIFGAILGGLIGLAIGFLFVSAVNSHYEAEHQNVLEEELS